MADISSELQAIMEATYGSQVRQSIHDAIEKINDYTESIEINSTASAYTFMGRVSDSSLLPTNGNRVGDCYYVSSVAETYAWSGARWHSIGKPDGDFNMREMTAEEFEAMLE